MPPSTTPPPPSTALSPNPTTIAPALNGTYTGPVAHGNAFKSKKPWTVLQAVSSSGVPLDETKWTLTVTTNGSRNDAVLTLAANCAAELDAMSNNNKIILAVLYTGATSTDALYVGL